MSIKIAQQCKEGLVLESNVTGPLGLGFPAHVAQLMAAEYKNAIKNDPIVQSLKVRACVGAPHDIAIMLGMQRPFEADFRIYTLGEAEGNKFELWVAEDAEGNTQVAFNTEKIRLENAMGEENAVMAVFAFEAGDLDEVLEALGTDLSGEKSVED